MIVLKSKTNGENGRDSLSDMAVKEKEEEMVESEKAVNSCVCVCINGFN